MATPVALVVNGVTHRAVSPDWLASRLAGLVNAPRAEVWLRDEAGAALCILKSDDRAFVMYLARPGDAGCSARADPAEGQTGTREFTLANGQVDRYPAAWTVAWAAAQRAAEYFWFARKPAPFIAWHDDG